MKKAIAIAMMALLCASGAEAGDRSQPATLGATTSVDRATQFNVYRYTLANPASNTAPLDTLTIVLAPGVDTVSSITSPLGWTAFYSHEDGKLMWAATGFLAGDTPNETGDIPPSDYAIRPGATLDGFSFKAMSQPGSVTAFVQSYAPLPVLTEGEDDPEGTETSTLPELNSFMTTTTGPLPALGWDGNRRPAVDGFLVFVNTQPRTEFQGSAMIILRLGSAGEKVDASSLKVELNGIDVSRDFVFLPEFNGYVAVFAPGTSAAKLGSNVLKTSVKGIEPGGTKALYDTDRLVFDLVK